jgi:hypothetical protein
MKVKCNDGIVRSFQIAYNKGDIMYMGGKAQVDSDAFCEDCEENFGSHDSKTLKPLFRAHICGVKTRPKKKRKPADKEYQRLLLNLLAVIHGDGGHYVDKHGIYKAQEDAMTIVGNWKVFKERIDGLKGNRNAY